VGGGLAGQGDRARDVPGVEGGPEHGAVRRLQVDRAARAALLDGAAQQLRAAVVVAEIRLGRGVADEQRDLDRRLSVDRADERVRDLLRGGGRLAGRRAAATAAGHRGQGCGTDHHGGDQWPPD
jgi:hypothetical protein